MNPSDKNRYEVYLVYRDTDLGPQTDSRTHILRWFEDRPYDVRVEAPWKFRCWNDQVGTMEDRMMSNSIDYPLSLNV